MSTIKDDAQREEVNVETEKLPYSKPTLTELGLLRTLTQGSF